MISVHHRRTRAQSGGAQVVTVSDFREEDVQVSHSQHSVPAHWHEHNSFDNIRLTPFGYERTDYTYSDSGSYRKDRIKNSWNTPDMSRLPIHVEKPIFTPDARNVHSSDVSLREMTRKLLGGRSNVPAVKNVRSRVSEFDSDESTGSTSVRSSTRSFRFVCKLVKGDLCTHSECNIAENKGVNAVVRQRNTNHTSDAVISLENIDSSTPSSRSTRQSKRVGSGTRIGSAVALTPTASTKLGSHSITSESLPVRDNSTPSSRLASTSSTYVYTYPSIPSDHDGVNVSSEWYVSGDGPDRDRTSYWKRQSVENPASDYTLNGSERPSHYRFDDLAEQSNNNVKQRSWVTKHIFGLEEDASVTQPYHFNSSDVEDVDRNTNSRLAHHRKAERQRLQSQAHRFTRTGTVALSSNTSWRLFVSKIKQMTTFCLTLLLTVLSYGYRVSYQSVSAATSFVRHLWPKVFGAPESPPKSKLALHPRLTQFDSQTVSTLTDEKEQSDFFSQSFRATAMGLSHVCNCCFRLLGLLCFLVPLGLLLAFLFAPVAVDDDEAPPLLPPFLSDSDCKRAIFDVLPKNASLIQVAYWRFRCLYELYFLTPTPFDSSGERSASTGQDVASESQLAWRRWFPWLLQYSSDVTVSPGDQSIKISDSVEDIQFDRLSDLARQITNRLDLLTKALQRTDDRLSAVELHSRTSVNDLSMQIQRLNAQFAQNLSFEHLPIDTHSLPSSHGQLSAEYTQLLTAVLDTANRTISTHLHLLFNDIEPAGLIRRSEFNSTVSRLSILMSHLRQHLMYRSRRTEDEFSRLWFQLQKGADEKSINHTTILSMIQNLQDSLRNLSSRITLLDKASLEVDILVKHLQDDIKRCTEGQLGQIENCKLVATENAEIAFARLSNTLKLQISDLVHEALFQHLNDTSVNSLLRSKLEAMVRQSTESAVRKVLYGSDTADGGKLLEYGAENLLLVQQIVDASLQRFAADRTGMADFALESAGGAIVGTRCTRTYTEGAALFRVFGIPLARLSNSPRTILQPGNNPGDCWPFHGSIGQAIIRLSAPVVVTGVSLEHLPRSLAPNGRLDSAPKEFQIKGLNSEHEEEGTVLGAFEYDVDGPPIQTFPIQNTSKVWQFVELAILSNHGHPVYTCVYRIRVHGSIPDS